MSLNYLPYIFVGGGIGAVLRYLISSFVLSLSLRFWFGTLIVNVIGSFILILLYKTGQGLRPEMELFLKTGVIGGLTTFSTMSFEIFQLSAKGSYLESLALFFLNIIFGIVVWIWIFR